MPVDQCEPVSANIRHAGDPNGYRDGHLQRSTVRKLPTVRCAMGLSIIVSPADRRRLETIVTDRKSAQKHVWRARIVLLTDDGLGTAAVMREARVSKTCVWRWQERFMAEGVDGLLRDRTRPPGKAPVPADQAAEIVRLTQAPPPHEATHWTARAMAKATGRAVSTVQKIWKAHGLAPHRWRTFKLSKDPAFAEKLVDIVGLYVEPPAHAVVLSVDEKSQELLAERRRGLLRQADQAQAEARRLPLRRRPAGRDQPVHHRTQHHRGQTLRLARRSRRDHRCPRQRVPSVAAIH